MKTKICKIIFIIISIFVFLPSCGDKDDKEIWKQPTDVGFIVDYNRSPGQSGKLIFTNGNIVLANFSFDGKRVQGDDVYFSNAFPSGLNIVFDPNTPVASLDFDIPQGTYTKIEISFETFGVNDDNHIVFEGTYERSMHNNYPVRFEFKTKILQTIIAKNSSGSAEITLNKDVPVKPKIILDPIFWFNPVSQSIINSAELVDIGGTSTILINDTCNENIYDIIVGRINTGSAITF